MEAPVSAEHGINANLRGALSGTGCLEVASSGGCIRLGKVRGGVLLTYSQRLHSPQTPPPLQLLYRLVLALSAQLVQRPACSRPEQLHLTRITSQSKTEK